MLFIAQCCCTQTHVSNCPVPEVHNGNLIGQDREFKPGDIASIHCKEGYRNVGNISLLRCTQHGVWLEIPPYCEEIRCGKLPELLNGTITYPDKWILPRQHVNISCDKGFLLHGPERLQCTDDGSWEPYEMLYCQELHCPDLPQLMNGLVQPREPTRPGKVEFTCNHGFILIGHSSINCNSDGTWLPNIMPFCRELQCPYLPQLMNGLVQPRESTRPGKVEFTCNHGFILIGHSSINCNSDGTWLPNIMPFCREIRCGKLPDLLNGTIYPDKPVLPREQVDISCDKGFLLHGPERLQCTDDGSWEPYEMIYCQELQCPDLPQLMNGLVQSREPTRPGKVEFICNHGFILIGHSSINCNSDGTWVPNIMPFCREMKCRSLPRLTNGNMSSTNSAVFPGNSITFLCNPGYIHYGPERMVCSANGTWEPYEMVYCVQKPSNELNIFTITIVCAFIILGVVLIITVRKLWLRRVKNYLSTKMYEYICI